MFAYSQIGSRYVIQITGLILILMAILGKIGAVLCLITEPIIGGMALISIAAILGKYPESEIQNKRFNLELT